MYGDRPLLVHLSDWDDSLLEVQTGSEILAATSQLVPALAQRGVSAGPSSLVVVHGIQKGWM